MTAQRGHRQLLAIIHDVTPVSNAISTRNRRCRTRREPSAPSTHTSDTAAITTAIGSLKSAFTAIEKVAIETISR